MTAALEPTPGFGLIDGPVRVVGCSDEPVRMVDVGERVRAFWQDYGHSDGTATVLGFERAPGESRVQVIVDCDHVDSLTRLKVNRWPATHTVPRMRLLTPRICDV